MATNWLVYFVVVQSIECCTVFFVALTVVTLTGDPLTRKLIDKSCLPSTELRRVGAHLPEGCSSADRCGAVLHFDLSRHFFEVGWTRKRKDSVHVWSGGCHPVYRGLKLF